MPPEGFKPAILALERQQTDALDRDRMCVYVCV